jgi:hypothetical protein
MDCLSELIAEDSNLSFILQPECIHINNEQYLTYLRKEGNAIQEAK